jgi:hypothetical protein
MEITFKEDFVCAIICKDRKLDITISYLHEQDEA